ncbi:MAG: ester cyclase [Gammaproteobacteria bacterium]
MENLTTQHWNVLQQMDGQAGDTLKATLSKHYSPHTIWNGSHPFNTLTGSDQLLEDFWQPFTHAFPDYSRHNQIFFGYHDGNSHWVASIGHYIATFSQDWIGIPANQALIHLRFGEFCQFEDGKIVKTNIQFDIPGLLNQVGLLPLTKGTGTTAWFPTPLTQDGIRLTPEEPSEGLKTLDLVNRMLDGLMTYDPEKKDLEQMQQHLFWAPDMLWYGPTGIGSTRAMAGFRRYHQVPFLTAFPDRKGGYHDVRMCAGPYTATCGWPSIHATHAGDYLGISATNQRIEMRVMDFWRRQDALLAENWVFIDLPHLLLQSGYDLISEGIALAGN